ncbi:hypothetical protein PRIPAC_76922, partial [Pristionchus pacificus]|uniref:G protein-coupled receptor n=1 Tax=Pristionchus pacificus TaxID=54126 RepID=A0A2A6C2Y3_PRIPA
TWQYPLMHGSTTTHSSPSFLRRRLTYQCFPMDFFCMFYSRQLTQVSDHIDTFWPYLQSVMMMMAVSFAHALILPTVHMTNCGVYFFSRHDEIIIGGRSYDTFFCLIFIVTFFQTFLILAYHFVYRCVTATSVHAPPEILEFYNIVLRNANKGYAVIALRQPDASTGWMVWHIPSVIGALILGGVFSATACVVAYCISRMNGLFKSSKVCFTAKTRKMQLDLFRALLIQTTVPVILPYVPVTIILVPWISLGAFGNVLFSITTIFPCIDAFFVLFFIARFRVSVTKLFRR